MKNMFKTDKVISAHKQRIHSATLQKTFNFCNECSLKYADNRGLRRHYRSRHEGIRFHCLQCSSVFADTTSLTSHIGTVHEGNIYDCKQCDMKLGSKVRLYQHTRYKHKGLLFICDISLVFQGKNYFWRNIWKSFYLPYKWYGRAKFCLRKGRY